MSKMDSRMELVNSLLHAPSSRLGQLVAIRAIEPTLVAVILETATTPAATRLRLHTAKLIHRLSSIPRALSFPLLVAFARSYGQSNQSLVRDVCTRVLDTDEDLSDFVLEHGPAILTRQIVTARHIESASSELNTATLAHLALARAHPLIASSYGQSVDLLAALAHLYDERAPDLEDDTRLAVLETTHALLSEAYLEPLTSEKGAGEGDGPLRADERAAFWTELKAALRPLLVLRSSSSSSSSNGRGRLGSDLVRYCHLDDQLQLAADGLRDADMLDWASEVVAQCRAIRAHGGRNPDTDGDWFERLKNKLKRARGATIGGAADVNGTGEGKGKGRASVQDEPSPIDPCAEAQILDLFPSLSPAFVRIALRHPAFSSSTSASFNSSSTSPTPAEALIAALLDEDTLPTELKEAKAKAERGELLSPLEASLDSIPTTQHAGKLDGSAKTPTPPSRGTTDRFDAPALNLRQGRLLRGKGQATFGPSAAQDELLSEQLKAAIIARAERESSDEDADYDEAFVPDPDDDEDTRGGSRAFGVRDAGEGGEHDAEEGGRPDSRRDTPDTSRPSTPGPAPAASVNANPFSAVITTYLEQTYAAHGPALFARNAETRRSKARESLRKGSGLTDERIEEWGVMFARNPKKDKILERHSIAPAQNNNPPSAPTATKDEPPHAHAHAQSQSQQGGSGRGGGAGSERGRGRGKSNGGREAHIRRSRGHDKKMQRMGAGAGL